MADTPAPRPFSLGMPEGPGQALIPPSGSPGYYLDGTGLEQMDIEFTVENAATTVRQEVVGIMCPFPDGPNSIDPSAVYDHHFAAVRAREQLDQGNNSISAFTLAQGNALPIPAWIALGVTMVPTKVVVTVEQDVGGTVLTVTDNGSGGFPAGGILSSGSVNTLTGQIQLTFNRALLGGADPEKIYVTYDFTGSALVTRFPTDWTVLTTWPTNRVRMAKGWCGRSDGTGVRLPFATLTTPRKVRTPTLTYFKLVYDPSMTAQLPTYAQHAAVTSGMDPTASFVRSVISDSNNNRYDVNVFDSSLWFENDLLEDTAWMRVYRRRSYHQDNYTGAASINRDFFSFTWYLYIPHNSRFVMMECRMSNDYQGTDGYENTTTATIGTGNGIATTFTLAPLPHIFNAHPGGFVRRDSVTVQATINGNVRRGEDATGIILPESSSTAVQSGSIDYGSVTNPSGRVSVTFANAPDPGTPVTVTYRHFYKGLYTGNGSATSFSGTMTEQRPSAYSVHIQADPIEGKDDGHGHLVPYFYPMVLQEQIGTGDGATFDFSGTLANDFIIRDSVLIRVAAAAAPNQANTSVFARDHGSGVLTGPGVAVSPASTINYTTGAYVLHLLAAPATGTNVYSDYGHDSTATTGFAVSGTVDYVTGEIAPTFQTAPANGTPIRVAYFKNRLSTAFSQDPNMHPLGGAGFNRWHMEFRNDQMFAFVEAAGTYEITASTSGVTSIANFCAGPGNQSGSSIEAGNNTTSAFVHEHLTEGSSLCRCLFLYFNTGSPTTLENNTWTSQTGTGGHPITPIATLDCFNATRAIHFFEGAIKWLTPPQVVTGQFFANTRAASTPAIARAQPGFNRGGWYAATAWGNGTVTGPFPGVNVSGRGARGSFDWREEVAQASNTGALRNGHFHAAIIWASQAWEAVRYAWHAGLHGLCRPNLVYWNFESAHKWRTRPFVKYIGENGTGLLMPTLDGITNTSYVASGTNSRHALGRGLRGCYGLGNLSVSTSGGVSTVTFTDTLFPNGGGIGVSGNPSGTSTTSSFYSTRHGSLYYSGLRHLTIQGSRRVYFLVSGSGQTFTLDQVFDGTTGSGKNFGCGNDPRPGVDQIYPRSDPRNYGAARISCQIADRQHEFDPENTTHCSQDLAFEVWCATGSWIHWDKTRFIAEYHLGGHKDFTADGAPRSTKQYTEATRAEAWTLKAILTAYMTTKYLSTQSPYTSFLVSPEYGSAADRYKEYLTYRNAWWLSASAKGYMDPLNKVAINGKSKAVDVRNWEEYNVSWVAPWNIGTQTSTPLQFGGGGGPNCTGTQLRFGEWGWFHLSVWMMGYHTPYLWVTWRELRFDNTSTELFYKSGVFQPLSTILFRLAVGASSFLIDYGWNKGTGPIAHDVTGGFVAWSQGSIEYPFNSTNLARSAGGYGYPLTIAGTGGVFGTVKTQDIRTNPPNPQYYLTAKLQAALALYPDSTVPNQIYQWRAAYNGPVGPIPGGATIPSDAAVGDKLGWPIPGTNRDPTSGGTNITTYENGHPNAGFGTFGVLPESRLETAHSLGQSMPWSFAGADLTNACLLSLYLASRWHSDTNKRQTATDMLNNILWQWIAASPLQGGYGGGGPGNSCETHGCRIEYENRWFGPITGDFPHVPTTQSTGDPTFWWNNSWLRRRRIDSDTQHSAYSADLDIFEVNLSTYQVGGSIAQAGYGDVRVLYQQEDGSTTVLNHTVRTDPVSGDVKLFFKPSVAVTANEVLHQSANYAYYVYYRNAAAASPAAWTNPDSIDGPFGVDANTVVLWNSEGTIGADAGPNNLPLIPTHAPATSENPTFGTGRFGGAQEFHSEQAELTILPFSSGIYPSARALFEATGSFTHECQFFARGGDLAYITVSSTPQVIASQIDNAVLPIIFYYPGDTRNITFYTDIGTSGSSVAHALVLPGPQIAFVAFGDSSTKTFSFTISGGVKANTVSIVRGAHRTPADGLDDGNGFITGPGIATSPASTVNYGTGAITVQFTFAPAAGIAIFAYYSPPAAVQWRMDRFNHFRLVYSFNSTVAIYLDGQLIASEAASGPLRTLTQPEFTGFAIGAANAPGAVLWPSDAIVSEWRYSNTARTTTRKLADPAVLSLESEEGLLETLTKQQSTDASFIAPFVLLSIPLDAALMVVNKEKAQQCSAVLVHRVELARSCDAVLQKIVSIARSTDAVIAKTQSVLRSTDARIAKTASALQSTDAVLQILTGQDVNLPRSTDAVLQHLNLLKLQSCNAVLAKGNIQVVQSTDAEVRGELLNQVVNRSCDAYLVHALNIQIPQSTDAILQTLGSKFQLTSAAPLAPFVLRAQQCDTGTIYTKLNATLLQSSDAALSKIVLLAKSCDAVLQKPGQKALSTDAVIQSTLSLAKSTDAVLSLFAQKVNQSSDAVLQAAHSLLQSCTSVLLVLNRQRSLSTDAILMKIGSLLQSTNAQIAKLASVQRSCDAILQRVQSVSVSCSATIVGETMQEEQSCDAALQILNLTSAQSTDAAIYFESFVTQECDAIVIRARTVALACSGFLFTHKNAQLIQETDCIVATIGRPPQSCDAALQIQNIEVSAACSGFLIELSSVLEVISPPTVTGQPRA